MTSATDHHDQGVDDLVDLLVDANARSHDLWGFLALAMARASNRVGTPHRFIGPRWDTDGGGVVMELIREGAALDTTQLLRWQAESIVETTYGQTLTADQVAAAAGVDPEPVRRALERLADEGRIHRDGDGYRY